MITYFDIKLPACCMLSCFTHVQLSAALWTVVSQAPLSVDSPGKNTGVGCYAFLQGIFLTQGSNPRLLSLLHCRQILHPLSHQGSPNTGSSSISTSSGDRLGTGPVSHFE